MPLALCCDGRLTIEDPKCSIIGDYYNTYSRERNGARNLFDQANESLSLARLGSVNKWAVEAGLA